MITRGQLREIHGSELPLHLLEQDYIQSLFLKELYKRVDSLVFKGGTFLKHAYGLDRFSEDLDFTMYREVDPIENLKDAASKLRSYGVEAYLDKVDLDDPSFSVRLRYRGPLFDGSKKSTGNIHIEVSKRNDVLLEPEWTRLFFEYPETRVVNVLSLQKEEVLAEKLRALSMREKGRDLYDVWFLLRQDVTANDELFSQKMAIV
ncbi:MAG: nucleotidyl transferase AbiEii/AbiGii toxin family protein, partial [Euryarchaeota archaeon]|nr:nucleotidyl transferase AbiEii/AbiGii toxin family protein [Euryarchaeota archaeon]